MLIDFNKTQETVVSGMNGGTGELSGTCHICPEGSEHCILNTGDEDLVMLTFVVER